MKNDIWPHRSTKRSSRSQQLLEMEFIFASFTRPRAYVASACLILAFLINDSAKGGFCGVACPCPDVLVYENEPFVRIRFVRADADAELWLDFTTIDGSARAGTHYEAQMDSVLFQVGETETYADVPMIDNGWRDGSKDFFVQFVSPVSGVPVEVWIRIEDNELGSDVDPLFIPDRSTRAFSSPTGGFLEWAFALPDGRVLLPEGPTGLTVLLSNGWLDRRFASNLTATVSSLVRPVGVLGDGRIIAVHDETNLPSTCFRLNPDGTLDRKFDFDYWNKIIAVQPDGKLIAVHPYSLWHLCSIVLLRLEEDGTDDQTFLHPLFPCNFVPSRFAFQSDGKILLSTDNFLTRLNPNGLIDPDFVAPVPSSLLFMRNNGKPVAWTTNGVLQLNSDGSVDQSFSMEATALSQPAYEMADGVFVASFARCGTDGGMVKWQEGRISAATDGVRGDFNPCNGALFLTGSGKFLAGTLTNVDGFPRPGFARLLVNPPERDFRVLTPAEFCVSAGVARLRIVRTGATTNAAFVSFNTSDNTAKAGVDYAAQSGTLDFAPLEVFKEVSIPLLPGTGSLERITFNLELGNPSPGYTRVAFTPVAILADLRVRIEAVGTANGPIAITVAGSIPGLIYNLEGSSDLRVWNYVAGGQAVGTTMRFDNVAASATRAFFRAVKVN